MKIDKEKYEEWYHDPANWRLGFFYYNKEDPRLFVPRRLIKFGRTINFANPNSIFFFVIILLFVLFALSSTLK